MHARPRDGNPADDVGRGWLAAHDRPATDSDREVAGAARADGTAASPALVREEFDTTRCRCFQWLRSPEPDGCSASRARRVTFVSTAARRSAACSAGARRPSPAGALLQRVDVVEFEPEHFQQMAGLVCYYNSAKFHYFYVSHDDDSGKHLRVMSVLPDQVQTDAFTPPIAIAAAGRSSCASKWTTSGCCSRIDRRRSVALAAAAVRRQHPVRRSQRARTAELHRARSSAWPVRISPGTALPADFDWFEYREREYVRDVSRLEKP